MKFCEYMYMLQGIQFCKYPDFKCKYHSEPYIMQAQMGYEEVTSTITFCELNKVEFSDLEDLIEE